MSGVLSQRSLSALFHASTIWIPGLSSIFETGLSRSEQPSLNSTADSWNVRLSANAMLYENLTLVTNLNRQIYKGNQTVPGHTQDLVDLDLDYRLTLTLFFRGGLSYQNDQTTQTLTQNYSVGWNPTPRLNTSAGAQLQTDYANSKTSAISGQISYSLSQRTNLFFSYSNASVQTDQTQNIVSYQLGFTSGF
jgi:hypothetical protein